MNINSLLRLFFVVTLCSELGVAADMGVVVSGSYYSPPEGNTTFIDGATWCIASSQARQQELQEALDWACGPGLADCSAIQPGHPCFHPDNLLSLASYAFNIYYQSNGNSAIACNFGGTALITFTNPSYGTCQFPSSGINTAANTIQDSSSSSASLKNAGINYAWIILLLACFHFHFLLPHLSKIQPHTKYSCHFK